ncbi:MAG: T9SS type A sorting domain-containing protein, partial [Raineya sp.]
TDIYYPWVLNPATPAAAATKGDNFRDNVEKIIIDNPVVGATYTIEICHKGTLQGGSQAYSMIVTGASSFAVAGAVTAPDALTALFSSDKTEGKNNEQITFTDASSKFTCSTPDITSWQWNFDVDGLGGASPSTFSGKNPPVVTFANSGIYKVRLMVSNGSNSSSYETEISIELANPTNFQVSNKVTNDAGINYVIDRVDLEWTDNSDEANFEVQRRENVTGSIYQIIATLPANQTTYSDNTILDGKEYVYRVRAMKGAFAPASSTQVFIRTVVIASLNNNLEQEFSIYPNPAKEKIFIQLGSSNTLQSVKILDTKGKIIALFNENTKEISISNLPQGLYLILVETSQGKAVRKLVIE